MAAPLTEALAGNKEEEVRELASVLNQVGKHARSESYLCALRALYAEGGMARLYRGIVLYNIKVAPSAAVQFATFHGLKRLVESRLQR